MIRDGTDGEEAMAGRAKDELRTIPGVGPSLARDLHDLGVDSIAALRRRNPERLYAQLGALRGARQDPCVLYVFRCAVYFARTPDPDPVLLRWWAWKDRTNVVTAGAASRSKSSAHTEDV